MRLAIVCLIAIASVVHASSPAELESIAHDEPSGEVVRLTDANFDAYTKGELPWLVMLSIPG